jgi:hypothetical protein
VIPVILWTVSVVANFMKNLLHVLNISDFFSCNTDFWSYSIGLFNRLYFNELLMVL